MNRLGTKQYEFSDHLGNVLVTILDKRTGTGNAGGNYTGWLANVSAVNDYYPFGMLMEERSAEHKNYRFSHNTQEKTDEIAGKGNHHTAQFWEYSPRIARRWNVDPIDQISISNYATFRLNPISYSDISGDSSSFVNEKGIVVGGTLNDGDFGVYKVKGLTIGNFNEKNISQYKVQGIRIGRTLSMNSFLEPSSGKWLGQVNFNRQAYNKIRQATEYFGKYIQENGKYSAFRHYMANAGNTGYLDIKSWQFECYIGLPWNKASDHQRINFVYQASFYDDNVIMTRRDQGNFFAGRAMKMIGFGYYLMESGFGAYQNNSNKLNFSFFVKSAINYIDKKIMGAATNGTPIEGLDIKPIYSEDPGSRDLQKAGYDQYSN